MPPDAEGGPIVTSDPYRMLDPEEGGPGDPRPAIAEAGTVAVLLRGLRRRCPRCGERKIWSGHYHLMPVCRSCSLRFENEAGGFLGAMVINYAVAIGLWLLVLATTLVVTVPDVPVGSLLVMSVAVLVGTPLWFYPRSKALWAAIEFLVQRSQPGYRTPAAPDPRAKDLE